MRRRAERRRTRSPSAVLSAQGGAGTSNGRGDDLREGRPRRRRERREERRQGRRDVRDVEAAMPVWSPPAFLRPGRLTPRDD